MVKGMAVKNQAGVNSNKSLYLFSYRTATKSYCNYFTILQLWRKTMGIIRTQEKIQIHNNQKGYETLDNGVVVSQFLKKNIFTEQHQFAAYLGRLVERCDACESIAIRLLNTGEKLV